MLSNIPGLHLLRRCQVPDPSPVHQVWQSECLQSLLRNWRLNCLRLRNAGSEKCSHLCIQLCCCVCGGGGWGAGGRFKSRRIGSSGRVSVLPPQTFHFTGAFCFVSQVVPDHLGSTSSVSVGPAWMVVPVGRSVLVVARGSRLAQTRWGATLPIPGLKQQLPSNVWVSPFLGLGASHLCHVVI